MSGLIRPEISGLHPLLVKLTNIPLSGFTFWTVSEPAGIQTIPILPKMLRTIYEQLGFFPTLFFSILFFISFIFWLAGIAGLLANKDRRRETEWITYFLIVFVPPYPIIWLIMDIFRQYFRITRKAAAAQLNRQTSPESA